MPFKHSQSNDKKVKQWQYNCVSSTKEVCMACCESIQERSLIRTGWEGGRGRKGEKREERGERRGGETERKREIRKAFQKRKLLS